MGSTEIRGTVILIDDDEDFLELFTSMLSDYPLDVVATSETNTIMSLIEENLESLVCILCDFNMPNCNGIELAKRVFELYKNIPIVLVTGFISLDDAKKMMEHDISGFINKPVEHDELEEIYENIIQPRQQDLVEKQLLSESFFEESENLYDDIETAFANYSEANSKEFLIELFRYVHTLKGSSGILERPHFTRYLHRAENFLEFLKSNDYLVDKETHDVVFNALDSAFKFIESLKKKPPNLGLYEVFDKKLDTIHHLMENKTFSKPQTTNQTVQEDNKSVDTGMKKEGNITVSVDLLEQFLFQSSKITVLKNMLDKLAQAILKDFPREKKIHDLVILLDEMNKINGNIQNQIVDLKKVPVSSVLRKVKRMIRDVSFSLNKPVQTVLSDNHVRLDPNISDLIANSLVHLVRNAIDHGIEPASERKSLGKPEEGKVCLEVNEHDSAIQISISDDGKGLDKDKLIAKAIKNQLISAENAQRMDEQSIFGLIFHSGFSTAKEVSEISGRGVGLDMVKSSIESYNGRILVSSKKGEGTTFHLTVPKPKSVMIINSLVVALAEYQFVIDQNMIFGIKILDLCREQLREVNDQLLISAFGQIVPILDIAGLFNGRPSGLKFSDLALDKYLLFLQEKDVSYAVLVDNILGSEESVVNKILPVANRKNCFLGATFMGDGYIGLVLNVAQVGHHFKSEDGPKSDFKLGQGESKLQSVHEICYLIFDIGYKHNFAILLDDIFRFERVHGKDIKVVGGQKQIFYSDDVLNVVDLYDILGFVSPQENPYGESFDLIVFRYREHFVGIPTKEVLSTYKMADVAINGAVDMPGYKGSFKHSLHGLVTIVNLSVSLKAHLDAKPPLQEGIAVSQVA